MDSQEAKELKAKAHILAKARLAAQAGEYAVNFNVVLLVQIQIKGVPLSDTPFS